MAANVSELTKQAQDTINEIAGTIFEELSQNFGWEANDEQQLKEVGAELLTRLRAAGFIISSKAG